MTEETEEKDFIHYLSPTAVLSAIFVCAGIFIYILSFWHEMSSGFRVLMVMGSGFLFYLLGITLFLKENYKKFASPTLFVGAFLELNGFSILMDEYFNNGVGNIDMANLIFFSIFLLQQACSFIALRIPVFLLISAWAAIAIVIRIFNMMAVSENFGSIIIGTILFIATYYFRTIKYPRIIEIGYLFSSVLIFVGAYNSLYNNIIFLVLSSFMLYISVVIRSSQLLVTSVIATLAFIAFYTNQNFADSISWPLMLIILGVLFFMISIGAMIIKKKYIK